MMAEKREMSGGADEGNTCMRTAETLLRLVPMGLCIAALVVMLKNSQTNDFGSLSYSKLGAFRSSLITLSLLLVPKFISFQSNL